MAQKRKNVPNPNQELDELDEAYYVLTGRKPKSRKKKRNGLVIALCSILTVVAVAAVLVVLLGPKINKPEPPYRYENIMVHGVSLDGQTQDEAQATLEALAQTYNGATMTVRFMEETILITPEHSGIALNIEQILADAKELSGTGENLDILPYLNLSEEGILQQLSPLESKYGITPARTLWEISGEKPSSQDQSDPGSMKLTISLGTPEYGLDMQKLYDAILEGYCDGNYTVEMDCQVVEPYKPDLDKIYAENCTQAIDAILDEKTFLITPEAYGYGFDLESAKESLEKLGYGQSLTVEFHKLQPAVTAQDLDQELFGDILGEYKTPHSGDKNRNENLRLACLALDGMVLMPGQLFSYNEALGERTAAAGYKPAASYMNGQTVDTLGGGICQVSSTLYYSCLLSDMEIVRRTAHGYAPSYMPMGMDATVSWGTLDYKFRNSNATPIRIKAWMEDGYVHVQIYGKETRSYYVEMFYKQLSKTDYEVVYKEYAPGNKEGYKDGQVLVTPYTGYKVKSYKRLIDRATGEVIETRFEADSTYKSRDKVICKIVDPAEEPDIPDGPVVG